MRYAGASDVRKARAASSGVIPAVTCTDSWSCMHSLQSSIFKPHEIMLSQPARTQVLETIRNCMEAGQESAILMELAVWALTELCGTRATAEMLAQADGPQLVICFPCDLCGMRVANQLSRARQTPKCTRRRHRENWGNMKVFCSQACVYVA